MTVERHFKIASYKWQAAKLSDHRRAQNLSPAAAIEE